MMRVWVILLLLQSVNAHAYDAFNYPNPFECKEGSSWNWYCDDKPVKPKMIPPPTPQRLDSKPNEKRVKPDEHQQTLTEFEQLKKDVQDSLSIAYMQPTESNLKRYFDLSNQLKSKASIFADAGQRFMWQNPSMDYLQRFPQSDIGKRTQLVQYNEQVNNTLVNMVNEGWGILFFFKSDCSYCHQQLPILTMINQKYRFQITPISVDGGLIDGLEGFNSPLLDRGQAQSLGISKTPSLMLANPKTGQTLLLSQGLQTFTELERRLFTLTTQPGENF